MMESPFLETKFHIPPWQANHIHRGQLIEKLQKGLLEQRKLTLVSAPAGYGKTTLIIEWLRVIEPDYKIAWLSLNENDNHPARFLSYWIASLHYIDPSFLAVAQGLTEITTPPHVEPFLDGLINSLTSSDQPIIMVLDDYHLINNAEIHKNLEYFIDHQPSQVHLIITTREDPPFLLARIRARGQMTEVRAIDLSFSEQEAGQFLSQSMKLNLNPEMVSDIKQRTEGWAVGLQLAGLALQNLPDPKEYIESFRGSHRYVLDYLAAEILHQQKEEVRNFLINTSILSRFNAPLCDALTDNSDSQSIINQLDKTNLFIVPLDNERNWYRYHQLFADYLQTELSKVEIEQLYMKTALWHNENGLTDEAVRYALLSKNDDFASNLIDKALNNQSTWSGGNIALLTSWVDALPPVLFSKRPFLCLNSSYLMFLSGRLDLAVSYIDQAEKNIKSLPPTTEYNLLSALVKLNRGSIAAVNGNLQQAIELITQSQAEIPRENHLTHARAFYSLGIAYEIAEQTDLAENNYLLASREAELVRVLFLSITSLCAAALLQIKQGHLSLAEQSCRKAIQLTNGVRVPSLGIAWSLLGGIALEQNNLTLAKQYLQDGISLSRQCGSLNDVAIGLMYLIRLNIYLGDTANATIAANEIANMLRGLYVPRMNLLAEATKIRVDLFQHVPVSAKEWEQEYRNVRDQSPHEFQDLTLIRYLLAAGRLDEIPPIIQPLLQKAESKNWNQTIIEANILLSLFHHAKGNTPSSLECLRKSITLAAPEKITRVFLDEGKLVFELLKKIKTTAPDFVESILNNDRTETKLINNSNDQLPSPLSRQEIQILKLIAAGKTNQQIADELVITVGTAKWHVHNILNKLNVENRTQAIILAKELNL